MRIGLNTSRQLDGGCFRGSYREYGNGFGSYAHSGGFDGGHRQQAGAIEGCSLSYETWCWSCGRIPVSAGRRGGHSAVGVLEERWRIGRTGGERGRRGRFGGGGVLGRRSGGIF